MVYQPSLSDIEMPATGGGSYTPSLSDLMPVSNTSTNGNQSFYDLSKEEQKKALNLARQQISDQYPNMPNWLRDMMLTITPKDKSPRLEKIASQAEAATNPIGVTAGGLLQGVASPFQGVASMIPGKTASDFANEDFTRFTPQPQNDQQKGVQDVVELAASLGPIGKLFAALKGGAQLARVPKVLQNATALAGTGAIATPGDAVNKALGAAGAVTLGGGAKVGYAIGNKLPVLWRGLTTESTPEALVQSIQKPHDILDNTANKLYGYVRDEIQKRGISIPVKQAYLDHAMEVLPKTRATQKLISDAKTGDYNAVHDLQSQLYNKGTLGRASDDIAQQNQGDEILDLRSKINDDLKDHLIQTGNVDIAHVLDQGKSVYKKIMDTYFNKDLQQAGGNGISQLVQKNLRIVPKNKISLVDTESKPMDEFLKQHPETEKHLKGLQEKNSATKALGKIFATTGITGGSLYGIKSIYDLLK